MVINAEAARADQASVFHHYRRLIELRHTDPVVVNGDFTMLLPDDEHVYAFTRRLGQVELLVVANVSPDEVAAGVPAADAWARSPLVLGTHPSSDDVVSEIRLRPWESRVYRRTG